MFPTCRRNKAVGIGRTGNKDSGGRFYGCQRVRPHARIAAHISVHKHTTKQRCVVTQAGPGGVFTFCGSLDLVVCVCVYIKIAPKGRASCVLFFQPNRIHCSEPPQPAIRAPMRVTRGPYPAIHNSLSLSLPKFLSVEGRSLLQQIHNLCNLKNTCDHESRRGE